LPFLFLLCAEFRWNPLTNRRVSPPRSISAPFPDFLSFQAEDVFELLVVARVVLRQADVADVELDTFSLQIVRLDALRAELRPKPRRIFWASSESEKSMNSLPMLGCGA
jgi:hypothetical protein